MFSYRIDAEIYNLEHEEGEGFEHQYVTLLEVPFGNPLLPEDHVIVRGLHLGKVVNFVHETNGNVAVSIAQVVDGKDVKAVARKEGAYEKIKDLIYEFHNRERLLL